MLRLRLLNNKFKSLKKLTKLNFKAIDKVRMSNIASIRTYLKEIIDLGRNAKGTRRADATITEGLEKIADFRGWSENLV